jgi:stage III sporulation protein AD
MLTAIRLVGVGLVAATAVVLLNHWQSRSVALVVRLGAVALILAALLPSLAEVVGALNRLTAVGGIRQLYLGVLLKVLGIAYLTTIGAALIQDMGEQALAGKVELAGKLLILVLAVPVLTAILQLLLRMLPS